MKTLPREKIGVYQGDPLWMLVLSQLKTSALALAPLIRELSPAVPGTLESHLAQQQYETFLSQIEDSYDLTQLVCLSSPRLRRTSLVQVAEDVGQNYARRFASPSSEQALILVDESLPPVNTQTAIVMRVLDCLLRAASRLGGNDSSYVVVKRSAMQPLDERLLGVTVECIDFNFGVSADRLQENLNRFKAQSYAHCINDLGLEVCAALHLAYQLGAAVEVLRGEAGESILAISFEFERADGDIPVGVIQVSPSEKIFICSESVLMIKRMKRLAQFHQVGITPISSIGELPLGAPLVLDVSCEVSSHWLDRKLSILPRDTVFLVSGSKNEVSEFLVQQGYSRLVPLPIVSSRLLRTISERHQPLERQVGRELEMQRLRVLVVDDAETSRIIIRDHLESRGHLVAEACDGSEFIELVHKGEQFDLVFCDLAMSHLDGLAAVRSLRDYEAITGTYLPVVMMTAYAAVEESSEFQERGVNYQLRKPISGNDVDFVIGKLFPKSRAELGSANYVEGKTSCLIAVDDLRSRCAGKTGTMIRVLESFLNACPTFRSKLECREIREDKVLLEKALHTIKGLFYEIAFREGSEAIAGMEARLKAQSTLGDQEILDVQNWLDCARNAAESVKAKL